MGRPHAPTYWGRQTQVSQSGVSAKSDAIVTPPNSTAWCRIASKTMACPVRALGDAPGLSCPHWPSVHAHVSPNVGAVLPCPPKSNAVPRPVNAKPAA